MTKVAYTVEHTTLWVVCVKIGQLYEGKNPCLIRQIRVPSTLRGKIRINPHNPLNPRPNLLYEGKSVSNPLNPCAIYST